MKTVLLVDRDRRTCNEIRSVLAALHKVVAVHTPSAAFKALRKRKPDVVLVKSAARDHDAVAVLEGLKEHVGRVPIVVLVGAGASGEVAKVRRLGASAVLRWPTPGKRLSEVVAAPGKTAASGVAVPPTLSATEARSSLEQLRRRLNRAIKCSVGKNAVLIRPFTNGKGATANPRIALECPLRAEFGLVPYVFYEYIRDRCSHDPNSCPALHIFRRREHDDSHVSISAKASVAPQVIRSACMAAQGSSEP